MAFYIFHQNYTLEQLIHHDQGIGTIIVIEERTGLNANLRAIDIGISFKDWNRWERARRSTNIIDVINTVRWAIHRNHKICIHYLCKAKQWIEDKKDLNDFERRITHGDKK